MTRKFADERGKTGLKELARIQELEVVEDWLILLVLVHFKPSDSCYVSLCGLCDDIEGPPFHFAITFNTQQVVVVILEVMEQDRHGGLV